MGTRRQPLPASMRIIVADFESYFDQTFSLSKMSTEEYVRSPIFKAHMLGLWEPARFSMPLDVLPAMLETNQQLRADLASSAVIAHHAQFDGLILEHHYGIKPTFWFDTLSMARLVLPQLRSHSLDNLAAHFGLGAKSVPYNDFRGVRNLGPDLYARLAAGCRGDVALTWAVFQKLLPLVPVDELRVIDATIRMFTEPCLKLDRPRMSAFLQAERVRKAKAMLAAGAAIGLPYVQAPGVDQLTSLRQYLDSVELQLQSSDKFRLALESLGYECPTKWSTAQEKDIPALAKNDDGMKELLEHDDPRVSALAGARLGVKSTIDETRAERLLESDARGALPVYLAYAAAKTLRFGGGDKTNWQNFRRGGEIRKSIQAPEGHKLVIGDLSQIEYRLLLWVAGQHDKLEALAAGRDLYCEFASEFYGETITKEDKPRRGVGKQATLMGGYGSGKNTMISTAAGGGYGPPVVLSDQEGQRMADLYRQGHPMVAGKTGFWTWCDKALGILASGGQTDYRNGVLRIADHRIWLPNGTSINYEGLRWASNTEIFPDKQDDGEGFAWWQPSRKGHYRIWGSKVTADVIQALACVVIKDVWGRVMKRGYRPALQVHDELVYCVPDALAGPVTAKEVTLKDAVPGTVLHLLLTEMETPPVWLAGCPLAAEGIVSQGYDK